MSELKKRLETMAVMATEHPSLSKNCRALYAVQCTQKSTIREFVREVNRRIDSQRIGAPEAIADTLKELGIEL